MKAEMVGVRQEMERIVALLLALAAIAERACHVAHPLRAHLLSLLWPAEAAAFKYVSGETALPAPISADVAEAAGLAARLRLLAIVVAGFVARLVAASRHRVAVGRLGIACAAAGAPRAAQKKKSLPSAPPFDTS
jgi:hypothetical protein